MKKRLAIAAAVMLLLCALLAVTVSAADAGNAEPQAVSGKWTYTITNGTAKITAYSGTESSITIPNTLDGYRVAIIGTSVFSFRPSLTSVTFNSNLVSIESYAFESCTGLTSITLPESLEKLGKHAFYNCTGLSSITINAKALSNLADTNCFYDAGKYASNGIKVTFGEKVTKIPTNLFCCTENHHPRINSVKIGSSVTKIGANAFLDCRDLTSVSWGSGLVSIDTCAFELCTSLTSAAFPESLIKIGYQAFYKCTSLSSITIPESVEELGKEAFYGCTDLASITINAKALSNLADTNCFYNAGKYAPNGIKVTFGQKATRVPKNLFCCSKSNYARVRTVYLGSAVANVGQSAFENCLELSGVFVTNPGCTM